MGNICYRSSSSHHGEESNDGLETNGVRLYISEHGTCDNNGGNLGTDNLGADYLENLSISSTSSTSSSSSSPMKIISGLWLNEKSKGKVKGIGNDDEKKSSSSNNIQTGLHIKLLPHKHTLFCERKQRICDAFGKIQELEILQIQNIDDKGSTLDISLKNCIWLKAIKISDEFVPIKGSENKAEYTLTKEDVGYFISFRHKLDTDSDYNLVKHPVGPVLPGPPRLLEIRIIGETKVGKRLIASTQYIGGYEGASEYWWIRIKDGERQQITEPHAINIEHLFYEETALLSSDPRVHIITNEDIGCSFKVKCRPVRSDGYKGEIVTSLSSKEVI
jgi:hypothetical protein